MKRKKQGTREEVVAQALLQNYLCGEGRLLVETDGWGRATWKVFNHK